MTSSLKALITRKQQHFACNIRRDNISLLCAQNRVAQQLEQLDRLISLWPDTSVLDCQQLLQSLLQFPVLSKQQFNKCSLALALISSSLDVTLTRQSDFKNYIKAIERLVLLQHKHTQQLQIPLFQHIIPKLLSLIPLQGDTSLLVIKLLNSMVVKSSWLAKQLTDSGLVDYLFNKIVQLGREDEDRLQVVGLILSNLACEAGCLQKILVQDLIQLVVKQILTLRGAAKQDFYLFFTNLVTEHQESIQRLVKFKVHLHLLLIFQIQPVVLEVAQKFALAVQALIVASLTRPPLAKSVRNWLRTNSIIENMQEFLQERPSELPFLLGCLQQAAQQE